MKRNNSNHILIITGLPFRRKGNQSLIRFVNMFLERDIRVVMFSAGYDPNGENGIENKKLETYKIKSCEIVITRMINRFFSKVRKKHEPFLDYFHNIKSEDVIAPYGNYTFLNSLNKWSKWILVLFDNFFLLIYILLKYREKVKKTDLIVGYEVNYTISSRILSKLFKKKYINKFQGTILKASERDIRMAIKYFPHNFFGINKSDLCLMVNDGTDGEYYAKLRGCEKIFFEPHGVFQFLNEGKQESQVKEFKQKGKFILFNNASGSTWKRTDRIIRALYKVDKEILNDIILFTTYFAADKEALVKFVKDLNLSQNVVFLEGLDSSGCNNIIRKSDVVIMTNDLSNLGNPILEAIYYKVPIISIDDGSLEGFLTNKKDSILIKLDESFNNNMAKAIERLYTDNGLSISMRRNLNKESQVRELGEQQEREFKVIKELVEE